MSDTDILNEIARLAGAINRHKNTTNSSSSSEAASSSTPIPSHQTMRGRGGRRGRGTYRGGGAIRKNTRAPFPYRRPIASSTWTREGSDNSSNKHSSSIASTVATSPVEVGGVQYKTSNNGSKLVRIEGDNPNTTPKKAVVDGVSYVRSKSGRSMIRRDKACPFFTRTGTCSRGKSCPYKHDPEHISLCKHFLKGNCNRPNCTLSHKPTPKNSPLCHYYIMGNCSNANCKFTHKDNVDPNKMPVCEEFAINGYCDNGIDCSQRHVFECPEFDKTGHCSRPNCKLQHILRAKGSNNNINTSDKNNNKVDIDSLTNGLFEDSEDEEKSNKEESESSEPESDEEKNTKSDITNNQDFIEL